MQCQRRGCGKTATHALKLCVPRFGQSDDATHVCLLLEVELCEDHADEADGYGFLAANPDLKSMFSIAMSNGPAPDFGRIYALGLPVTDPEYMAMKLAGNRKPN